MHGFFKFFIGAFVVSLIIFLVYLGITYGKYDGDWGWPGTLFSGSECTKKCVNGELDGSACICVCPVGFTGDYCETKKGSTVPPPPTCDKTCGQGQLDVNNCTCICQQGFKKVQDSCIPCENGCVNGTRQANGCSCACKIGWYGPDCNSRDPIDNETCDKECQYGTLNSDCQCDCWRFYSGANCATRDCSDTPCVNGTQDELCNCTCNDGWMGRSCNEPLEPACSSTVCYNGNVDDNCNCVCDDGFTGQTCRIVGENNESVDYAECQSVPGAVWTGYQCMTVEGGCPMGPTQHHCVNRSGFNYIHEYGSNDPWQCVLGDESNGGYMGDPSSYYYGGRCMTAQSTAGCTQLLEDMSCTTMPSELFENL